MEGILVLVGIVVWMLMEHPVIFWSIVGGLALISVLRLLVAVSRSESDCQSSRKPEKGDDDFLFFEAPKKTHKRKGKCSGDCKNCPPHYGYRYGRWYYGHGHNHGCEFGGNKGGGGRD